MSRFRVLHALVAVLMVIAMTVPIPTAVAEVAQGATISTLA
jgi:hypothetical protein